MNIFTKHFLLASILFTIGFIISQPSRAASGSGGAEVRSMYYMTSIRPYQPVTYSSILANEVGVDGAVSYVSDLEAYWKYSSLHYYRNNQYGTFGGRINAANRFGTSALQYQAEAYPILFAGSYAALSLAYANTTQTLFPSYQYRAEGYFPLLKSYEFSLGQGGQMFPRFDNEKIFLYTGSLGKYMGNYFMWYRPYYFTPKSALLSEIGLRRSFEDPDTYVSARATLGHLPDIGDLPPNSNLVILSQNSLGLNAQFPLGCHVYGKADVSYAHQVYQTGLTRNITTGFLGIFVRFN